MQVTFNAKEQTLREIVTLALSAGVESYQSDESARIAVWAYTRCSLLIFQFRRMTIRAKTNLSCWIRTICSCFWTHSSHGGWCGQQRRRSWRTQDRHTNFRIHIKYRSAQHHDRRNSHLPIDDYECGCYYRRTCRTWSSSGRRLRRTQDRYSNFRIRIKYRSAPHYSRLNSQLHIDDYECCCCTYKNWSQIRQRLGNHPESFFASGGSAAAAAIEYGVENVMVRIAGVGKVLVVAVTMTMSMRGVAQLWKRKVL